MLKNAQEMADNNYRDTHAEIEAATTKILDALP